MLIQTLDFKSDDRGNLYEILRADNSEFKTFGQVYLVEDRTAFTVRAFHKHEKLIDYFCIIQGAAKFIFWKDKDKYETVILDSKKPQLIIVPPPIWHGWMSLEDNTKMISIASEMYNKEKPDETRCDPYILGDIWKIQAK